VLPILGTSERLCCLQRSIEADEKAADNPNETRHRCVILVAPGYCDEIESLFADAGFESIEIERKRLELCYPSPDEYVDLGVASASAAVPERSTLDEKARRSLVIAIRADMEEAIRQFSVDDKIVAPMEAHVVIARKAEGATNR